MTAIQIVFGGAGFQHQGGFADPATLEKTYVALENAGCKIIDTATRYGASEEILGHSGGSKRFTIDTKAPGGIYPGSSTAQGLQDFAHQSRKNLTIEQVDVWYLHAPDTVPIEETLRGVNEAYKQGWFRRFGLSNYLAEDVQKIHDICKREGYPLPSVYQGDYSPITRKQETLIFPTLRELGISFYAYSPLAGGFLVKSREDMIARKGRLDPSRPYGDLYNKRFGKNSYLEALAKWAAAAEQEGTTKAELAYRWVRYNSALKPEHGDAIIIGASSLEQLEKTLSIIDKGPLSETAVYAINDIWESVKVDATLSLVNDP